MALENLLREDLLEDNIRIRVQEVYQIIRGDVPSREQSLARSKTLGKAKSLLEFYDLVRQAIEDYEKRAGTSEEKKIFLTEEDPDISARTETITLGLVSRDPGAFQQGAPQEAKIKNLRPRLREEVTDPDNSGYRMAITGFWYDIVVRFTCWANTNKTANTRALWFQDLMEEYSWFFKIQGVDRCLFIGQRSDLVLDVAGKKWYGRPIDFFVRTERLRVFSEKTIEEILIEVMTKNT